MSEKESRPPQKNPTPPPPSPQSPRDIRLVQQKQIQNRNAHLQSELNKLESHRQSLAAELRMAIAEPENAESDIQQMMEGEEMEEEGQEQLEATIATAQTIVQKHIRLLHDYNAVKDVGQGLFGLIADGRGVRLREIHEEYGMVDSD